MTLQALENRLKTHAETVKDTIAAPFELKQIHKEVLYMQRKHVKRMIVAAAICTVCISAVALTPFASTIKGYFRDITRWDSAITGTEYVNATHEVKMAISGVSEKDGTFLMPLTISFVNKAEAPFAYIQEIAITEYTILDKDKNEVLNGTFAIPDAPKGTISDGKAEVLLSAEGDFQAGTEYTVLFETLHGLSKADAPLVISGSWSCNFIP